MHRRDFVHAVRKTALGLTAAAAFRAGLSAQTKSRYKQSAMLVNFAQAGATPSLPFDEICKIAAKLGLAGMDLIPAQDWPTLKKHGLICTMEHDPRVTFEDGIIHPEVHAQTEKAVHEAIDHCAANGCPNTIVVGGQKRGMPVEQAKDNAVAFLNKVKAHAEDKGVTILLEPVNRFDRPDQLLDHVAVAVDLVKRVNSPRVKLLFDIYHAQRIDGDVSQSIRDNYQHIGHIHTAGVPGRREIDDAQELNYHFIAQTIASLGYTGYISHEWRLSPGHDAATELARAIQIMTV
jgi:hydroxypyruvate isomerase